MLEMQTESGSIYTINVVEQKLHKTFPDGRHTEVTHYRELKNGQVGQGLDIIWNNGEVTHTTKIVKIAFRDVK